MAETYVLMVQIHPIPERDLVDGFRTDIERVIDQHFVPSVYEVETVGLYASELEVVSLDDLEALEVIDFDDLDALPETPQ